MPLWLVPHVQLLLNHAANSPVYWLEADTFKGFIHATLREVNSTARQRASLIALRNLQVIFLHIRCLLLLVFVFNRSCSVLSWFLASDYRPRSPNINARLQHQVYVPLKIHFCNVNLPESTYAASWNRGACGVGLQGSQVYFQQILAHTHTHEEDALFITVTFSFHTQPKNTYIYIRASCAPALKHNADHLTVSSGRSTPWSSASTFS